MRHIITLVAAVSLGIGCATASSPIDDSLPATQDTAPNLPPPSIAPSAPGTTPSDTTTDLDASAAPPPKKDASTPPPPPPPPQICINEAGAALPVQTPCGCDKDCTTALVCAQVGALLEPWCCVPLSGDCVNDNDCCGEMLCNGGEGGTKKCK